MSIVLASSCWTGPAAERGAARQSTCIGWRPRATSRTRRTTIPKNNKQTGGLMALEVLIVDDEADIRELVAGVLEDKGYQTRSAANSDDALTALSERRPSLVLLDLWLHGSKLDGTTAEGSRPPLPIRNPNSEDERSGKKGYSTC